ncbi:YncE family protein [Roseisolibacter sp. H3M3-2]|uniref:YncE family protein n=1 Tax=Roseisolibacter sp. H3M3-2 TaxID=3031323 RepID=UPI0023DCE6B7|nr:YncE family protein [Roseisolibacter sp. H3M3-2]MDF1504039.1 YncE family protein [Roseisolibacter sp. H3M3-2]
MPPHLHRPSMLPRPLVLAALLATPLAAQRPTGTLVVSNMNDHTATLLDAATGRVLATLPTGEGPHEVAVSHDGRTAVVTNYGVRGKPGSTITVIDVPGARVARTLTLAGLERPHGAAFLPGDTLLAVTAEAQRAVAVVDARDGRVVATRPTGGRGSHMLAIPARGDRVFTANIPEGTVSAFTTFGADSARAIPVGRQPEGIAVSPDGRHVWVGSNRDSTVLVLDVARGVAVDTLRGFGMPYRIAVSPDGRTAVISDPVRAEIRVVSAGDRKVRHTIAVPADSLVATAEVPGSASPEGVAISRDSRWAFVTLQGRNRVATVDLARGAIVATAPTGVWSDGVGYSPVVVAPGARR